MAGPLWNPSMKKATPSRLLQILSVILAIVPFLVLPASGKVEGSLGNVEPTGYYAVRSAYAVGRAFTTGWLPCIDEHYGAFFPGSNGYNQHYVGPGGDSATCISDHGCISQWDWWGTYRSVLLLPKSWLYSVQPCFWKRSDAWVAANYRATVWID